MTEPSLALQKGLRALLVGSSAVTSLVDPGRIVDGRKRPELFPCVILGEGQTVLEAVTFGRQHVRVFVDLHCWTNEAGLADVKALAGAVQHALREAPEIAPLGLVDGFVAGARFLRDPGGEHGHAVITYEALVEVST